MNALRSSGTSYRVPYLPRGTTYSEEEIEVLRNLLESDETLSCGRERTAFEVEFARFVGVEPARVVATSSCTVSLELAIYLAKLRPGDNVVVTAQSYQATLNPLLSLDVEVRFADIDEQTLCLDPASIGLLVDHRTKAVILTHYGGLMVDMDHLDIVLVGSNVLVIEDCAHAHGSALAGRRAGSLGHLACYSFQSMKNMSTLGQGGMMILPSVAMAERVRRLIAVEPDAVFQPRSGSEKLESYTRHPSIVFTHEKNAFSHDCVSIFRHGTNSTLAEPAAAVGRVQLRRLHEFLDRRRSIADRLDGHLLGIAGVRPQKTPANQNHSHHLYTCFVDAALGNQAVAAGMVERGVEIQQRYFPLHLLPEWRVRGGYPGQCPVTERVWFEEQLNLPIYPAMTDDQVDYMAEALHDTISCL